MNPKALKMIKRSKTVKTAKYDIFEVNARILLALRKK